MDDSTALIVRMPASTVRPPYDLSLSHWPLHEAVIANKRTTYHVQDDADEPCSVAALG